MVINGVSFNDDWVKTKSLKQFIEHEKHHGLSDEVMKEYYETVVPPKKIIEKPNAGKADVKAPHE
jgi:hypothetical protein